MVRDKLVAALEESLRIQQQLVDNARDDGIPVADLLAQILTQKSVLERLDRERDELINQLRLTASHDQRAARTGPPIRDVVLQSLADFRWPQQARFVQEYLWAKQQLQLNSRAVASLRRDERNAWRRAPGTRDAYIAPALNPDGSPNPRWITSSAWPLDRRIVASPQTERLFDLYKIYALTGRPGSAEASVRGPRPIDALLAQYAKKILGTEPPPVSASPDDISAWRERVQDHAGNLIGEIRRDDEPYRKQFARQLASLSDRDRIWGQDKGPQARKGVKTRLSTSCAKPVTELKTRGRPTSLPYSRPGTRHCQHTSGGRRSRVLRISKPRACSTLTR